MPIARVTIDKVVASKLQTQLNKPVNKELKEVLARAKKTLNQAGGVVLWEPDPRLCDRIVEVLEREQGFMRKKGSISFTTMTENIKRLKAYQP